MTIASLHDNLQELGIPQNRYYLHGLFGSTDDSDKLALVIKKGKYTVEYEVYFKEKGEKNSIRVFATEEEACIYIYRLLIANKDIEDK
jgi:hypothetical protein